LKAKRSLSGLQRIYEAGFILVSVLSLFTAFSLITFSPSDPSWSQTAWQGPVQNATGPIGAWLSDLLLFSLGYFAYFTPLAFILIAWSMFWHPMPKYEVDYIRAGVKIVGFIFCLVGITGLANINWDDFYFFSSGGLIGDLTVRAMVPLFGMLGTTLVLLFAVAAGFTLFTGVSWIYVVDIIGSSAIYVATKINKLPQMFGKFTQRFRAKDHALSDENDPLFAQKQTEDVDEPQLETKKTEVLPIFENEEKQRVEAELETKRKAQQQLIEAANDPADAIEYGLSEPENVQDELPTFEQDHEPEFPSEKVEPTFGGMTIDIDDNDEPEFFIRAVGDDFDASHYEEVSAIGKHELETPQVDIDSELGLRSELESHSEPSMGDYDPVMTEANVMPEIDPQWLAPDPEDDIPDILLSHIAQNNRTSLAITPLPSFDLLDRPNRTQDPISKAELDGIARLVEVKLLDFNIQAKVVAVYPGPVITRFELDLAPGIKVAKISSLDKDLARALSAISVRVVDVIPGKSVIGLELPNKHREIVYLSEVLNDPAFSDSKSHLSMVLGKDIAGESVVVDLAKMPHLLVAGTTGSGKSVGVNVMIVSLLYKSTPEQVRMIMIDPKMLELSVYDGIPHLLAEVVTDMKEAANALRWCVGEMERRYKLLAALGVRNLAGYNSKIKAAIENGSPIVDPLWKPGDSMDETAPLLEHLPSIVVVVDEFADMMMIVGKKVEELIARIAQKARAAGIHLILATQRPSVDVITGLIKANIPTRIAFQVSSKIDSRTILDQGGAESLLGQGDMLYMPPGTSIPTRVHGAFVDDHEVHRVVSDWKARGKPNYIKEILEGDSENETLLPGEQSESDEEFDPLYDQALAYVTESRRGSVSGVQRKLKVGYNRAARIIEQMEGQGIVSAPGHNGNREVLAPAPVKDDY